MYAEFSNLLLQYTCFPTLVATESTLHYMPVDEDYRGKAVM
jgi:hypothetical protein